MGHIDNGTLRFNKEKGKAGVNELRKDLSNMSSMRKNAERAAGTQVSDIPLRDKQHLSVWHR